MSRILEGGHYYAAKGPTKWAVVGWNIMKSMVRSGDRTLLFVDNIHGLENVSSEEVGLPEIEGFVPDPDFKVLESEVVERAWRVLEILRNLPQKKKRTKESKGRWWISGFPLTTNEGVPTCVLLDMGLTLLKKELGFGEAVNVLPYFYAGEQKQLLRLVEKTLPEFKLQVILFDLKGNYWEMDEEE